MSLSFRNQSWPLKSQVSVDVRAELVSLLQTARVKITSTVYFYFQLDFMRRKKYRFCTKMFILNQTCFVFQIFFFLRFPIRKRHFTVAVWRLNSYEAPTNYNNSLVQQCRLLWLYSSGVRWPVARPVTVQSIHLTQP